MKLLADKTGELFLTILEQSNDIVTVQFITNEGDLKGSPFTDSLSSLLLTGWTHRKTATGIGFERFKQGFLEDPEVSFALHQLFPLGRNVQLPSGRTGTIASYANTHSDGYYMYLRIEDKLERLKIGPDWKLLPSQRRLGLPYYPAPKTEHELNMIRQFDAWSGGY